jgi:hypothetical protein
VGVREHVGQHQDKTHSKQEHRNNDPLTQFKLYLDSITATLKMKILLESEKASSVAIDDVIITDSFPIQKWTHITVSVDSQYCDMYVDGKLSKSIKYSSTPVQPQELLFR